MKHCIYTSHPDLSSLNRIDLTTIQYFNEEIYSLAVALHLPMNTEARQYYRESLFALSLSGTTQTFSNSGGYILMGFLSPYPLHLLEFLLWIISNFPRTACSSN